VCPKGVKIGGKTLDIKIKDKNPYIKNIRQMKAQVDITQKKKETKESTNNKEKTLCK
jgi:hypothetical protein